MSTTPASTPESHLSEEPAPTSSILDALLPVTPRKTNVVLAGPTVGECINDHHPVLLGRYQIRWTQPDGTEHQQWLPALHGTTIRTHDRVLLTQPVNWPEALITGVVDGFALRPEAPSIEAARIQMRADEVVRIESERGVNLLELSQGENGPVVRLLSEDVQIDLPGDLNISARSLKLQAKLGAVGITATDDVTIRGEQVNLN